MPIGLLSDIAANFGITESHAGLLISVYSWVVTLLSLPLMLLVSKMSYRKLLLGTIALFGIFQVLSGVSASYGMLMVSRIGVACTHAIFWSVASPIAVRLVPEEHQTLAMSMIVTGTSVAMIFGLPLGRVIGLTVGWRMTFLCVAAVAFLVLFYLLFVFPKMSNETPFQIRQLPQILKRRQLLGIYLITFLVASAYYTGYSYIEPFLKQVAHLADSWITIVLTLFGAAGLLGSFLFSRLYDKHRYAFIRFIIASVAVALLCLRVASVSLYLVILVCVLWGWQLQRSMLPSKQKPSRQFQKKPQRLQCPCSLVFLIWGLAAEHGWAERSAISFRLQILAMLAVSLVFWQCCTVSSG